MNTHIVKLFSNALFQMNLVYSQNHDEKGDSWREMGVEELRTLFFKEYHEFVDSINTLGTEEIKRYFELIDTLLVGHMLAERWFHELIANMQKSLAKPDLPFV